MHFRRSRLDRLTAWAPVMILAALAALTFWLDAQVQKLPVLADGSSRHDPDLTMENFVAIGLAPDGGVQNHLTASRARHYPDDGTTELEHPTFVLTQPNSPRLEVTADRGRMTDDREHAYFYGAVRATRAEAAPDQPLKGPLTLTTEYLHVVPSTQRISTDQPVTITEPRAIIRGAGLDYDHQARTIRITTAHGEFAPGLGTALPFRK